MPKKPQIIEPINAEFSEVAKAMVRPRLGTTIKDNKNKDLEDFAAVLGATPNQQKLFHVERQVEINDIEMGVLESGVPYLSGRGLERMCGVGHGPFYRMVTDWQNEQIRPRGAVIKQLLEETGYVEQDLYIRAELNGKEVLAFTEPVCMAMLEYFAFFAPEKREQARKSYRTLAKAKFRDFIYDAIGYSPDQKVLDSWRHFHDRVDMTLDAVPVGYFSVFKEIAAMIVPMIRAGIMISDRVVPDISVGKAWSVYWDESGLSAKHPARVKYDHEYPLYYPQAKSNPQPSYAYPDSALGEFRAWLRANYIVNKFPNYLLGQTKKGTLAIGVANKALEAFSGKLLEAPKRKKTIS